MVLPCSPCIISLLEESKYEGIELENALGELVFIVHLQYEVAERLCTGA